jgi:hypothetical protein
VVTTAAARVSAMTWQIAVELSSTHCHHVLPQTRAEVSSEPTTGLARTAAAIGAAAASSGVCARARIGRDNEYWPTCADEYWPTPGVVDLLSRA